MACHNCRRFNATPYVHSFSTPLNQTKNQSWQPGSGWLVTPTTARGTDVIPGSTFCSGDCLYSYIFSHELLSNKEDDAVLHFFKRVDVLKTAAESSGRVSVAESAAESTASVEGDEFRRSGSFKALYRQQSRDL
jgi:hypothetical protein